eukprot:EST42027.1 Hypothetical protein SS50377_18334 [Spironucleus salmonicida]
MYSSSSFSQSVLSEIDQLQHSIMSKYITIEPKRLVQSKKYQSSKYINDNNTQLLLFSYAENQQLQEELSVSKLLLSNYKPRRAISCPKKKKYIDPSTSPAIYGQPTIVTTNRNNFLKRSDLFLANKKKNINIEKQKSIFSSPTISELAKRSESAYSRTNVLHNYMYGSTILSYQKRLRLQSIEESYRKRQERKKYTHVSRYNQQNTLKYSQSLYLDHKINQFMDADLQQYFQAPGLSSRFYYDQFDRITPKTYNQYITDLI